MLHLLIGDTASVYDDGVVEGLPLRHLAFVVLEALVSGFGQHLVVHLLPCLVYLDATTHLGDLLRHDF